MADSQQNKQSDFIIEKIKVKPVNKKKLIRRMLITISMAIIFGLVACVTFLILEPVISNWLYPEEEPQVQTVKFPEDREELSPEEMLAENLPTETPSAPPSPTPSPTSAPDPDREEDPEASETGEPGEEEFTLSEEQIQDVLSRMTMELKHYKELYGALGEYAEELRQYMVTVTAVTTGTDWLTGVQESSDQCSGVIISENGMELLILTDYSAIASAERCLLTFYDDSRLEAQLKQFNSATNLAVLSVPLEELSEEIRAREELPIVKLGYSGARNMAGTPVVAVGSPMGVSDSVGYGMITSANTTLSETDRNYKLLLTDISGSRNASGVLFDLQGQLIGIITTGRAGSDMENVITAYGITELQRVVEKMSNAAPMAYLGIRGADVTAEANRELGVPLGAYVEEVELDSPAMREGIQRGDVITEIDEKAITSFGSYSNALMQTQPGQTVTVKIKRQAQDEYREMEFSIELGGADR